MSTTDDELKEIYSNAPIEKQTFQVVSLHASWFSQKYYLQNMDTEGVDVTLEDGVTVVTASYAPMSISESGNNGDMSYTRTINIQALNDSIAEESSNRDYDSDEEITVETRNYVVYRDGTISSIKGSPLITKVSSSSRNEKGTTVSSRLKSVTSQSTGEVVSTERVPMTRGWL